MYHSSESFDCPAGTIVFRETGFSGMVGESCSIIEAFLISPWGKTNSETKSMEYEELRGLYKTIEGRKARISYHRWMSSMSPEGIRNRAEAETSDAISRVI